MVHFEKWFIIARLHVFMFTKYSCHLAIYLYLPQLDINLENQDKNKLPGESRRLGSNQWRFEAYCLRQAWPNQSNAYRFVDGVEKCCQLHRITPHSFTFRCRFDREKWKTQNIWLQHKLLHCLFEWSMGLK